MNAKKAEDINAVSVEQLSVFVRGVQETCRRET